MMCHPVSTAVGPVRSRVSRPHVSRPRATGLAARLNTTWITAGVGAVILIVSMALMAYSAPGRAPATVRPLPASHAQVQLPRAPAPHARADLPPAPGPLPGPGRYRGSELRPSR